MKNNIMELLDLADSDSELTDCWIEDNVKHLTIQKKLTPHFCPHCGSRLHSKGLFHRHPNNQVLQDGYLLDIDLIGRRWFCPDNACGYSETDQFSFIDSHKKNTKITEFMILQKMKDISLSCVQVARMFNVSDTYVHDTFTRFVDLKRKPMTEIISIDEVYLNTSYDAKYALIIMDFTTGEILDIVRSRREADVQPYFESIPMKERLKVKKIVCDMYSPYVNYTRRFFIYASAVTDSFHVIQWLINKINLYINHVKKRYQERDRKVLDDKNQASNNSYKTSKDSREVYILKRAAWVLLKNSDDISYVDKRYDHFLDLYLDTYDWQKLFLDLDPNFRTLLDYKEKYITFSHSFINDPKAAEPALLELISLYRISSIDYIREFGNILHTYRRSILNSFEYISVEKSAEHQEILRRVSNGPMESFNNIPSSYRTRSHGLDNFEFTRNRILWSVRKDAEILAVPKSLKDIHSSTPVRKRGTYKK